MGSSDPKVVLKKLEKISKKKDIGYRFINESQGHIRVDSDIDFWLTTERWSQLGTGNKGKGLNSMIYFIESERENE